ncbi:4-(cytidine 5'-diphospho)-2-C-methyl-D-erythritol kinase [Chelativorans sp. YIM 93263]|uniref:4-(cytidine 5'-diphospho)-2-C-methyl-D-erythritol kinase n=1 Tax=Chelativorans sp. YIM 93263 TaxID=2906648 RepID=UPI0023797E42|nr:4-(cytidine 5'-diphospho)-2-C-methyl-D-erythritol kinase [Chelativorans sp. YIM 93263]
MNPPLESFAPAKINLALHVTGRRADGYHLLETLVVFACNGDRLTAQRGDRDSFEITGPFAQDVPSGEDNLVLRVRDLMREHFSEAADTPVRLSLEKNLPVASGIGGGSSDAAATLALLGQFWSIRNKADAIARIAFRLGADVPMCMTARPLVAHGIGDEINMVADFPEFPLLLVNPGVPLATPAVFKALMSRHNPPLPSLNGKSRGEVLDWLASTRNDLEAPALALRPEIGRALGALKAQQALFARMSGSGATCFGIFESIEAAERAARAIAEEHPGWFVKATTTMPAAQETVIG